MQSGLFRTGAFILGCFLSGLTGFIGMSLAVRGNVRTAAAAKRGSMPAALQVAFRTGGVAGMFTVGLGLLGASLIMIAFQNTSSAILVGFGFGGSLLALFLRVGGGIFTKAADVGADLVGKVEAGIPEDDPRNPATIADNVGDNVGDCAGMAADLFESYEVTLVASIILGVPAFQAIFPHTPALWAAGALFPLAARAIGVLASIVGVFAVKATDKDKSAMAPINRGFLDRRHPHHHRHARAGVGVRRQPEERHAFERRLAHVRCGRRRSGARADRVAHHRVLHVDRDQARAGDRRIGVDRWSGHCGARRYRQRSRVVGVGDHRDRRCDRGCDRARRRRHPVLALPRRPHRYGHARHDGRGRVGGHVRSGRRQRGGYRRDVG